MAIGAGLGYYFGPKIFGTTDPAFGTLGKNLSGDQLVTRQRAAMAAAGALLAWKIL